MNGINCTFTLAPIFVRYPALDASYDKRRTHIPIIRLCACFGLLCKEVLLKANVWLLFPLLSYLLMKKNNFQKSLICQTLIEFVFSFGEVPSAL